MNFSEEQKIILDNYDNNIFINAGAGAGKSTLLSHICNRILNKNPNNKVLLMTFTNKSAKDIISKCAISDTSRIIGGTFHGIAYKYMSLNKTNKTICDENKQQILIKKIFDCKKDKKKFNEIMDTISNIKSEYPCDYDNKIVSKYQDELDKYNLMDFDDIIFEFIKLAENKSFYISDFTHILVDELQDTSGPQLEMLKRIQNRFNTKVVGVGDGDQAIYEWRGAKPGNINDFIKLFNCNVLNMGINFRCSKTVVKVAAKVVSNNKNRIPKKLDAFKEEIGFVKVQNFESFHDQIDEIISTCNTFKSKEIVILYRNRSYKNYLEFALKKHNLKYIVNDFLDISDRSAVKTIVSLLKVLSNNFDEYDLLNSCKILAGIGEGTINKIVSKAKEEDKKKLSDIFNEFLLAKPKKFNSYIMLKEFFNSNEKRKLSEVVSEIEKYMISSYNYQDDMKKFLIDMTADYKCTQESVGALYNEFGLGQKSENNDENARIQLSTIHGFKGAEQELVILPWLELFKTDSSEIEAERRLLYVALTRAKSGIYVYYSGNYLKFAEEIIAKDK